MEKELFDYVAERAGILATADTSKQDTKDAAAAWKDAIAADSSDAAVEAATNKLLDFLEGRPTTIDGVIAFAQGPAKEMMGEEVAAKIARSTARAQGSGRQVLQLPLLRRRLRTAREVRSHRAVIHLTSQTMHRARGSFKVRALLLWCTIGGMHAKARVRNRARDTALLDVGKRRGNGAARLLANAKQAACARHAACRVRLAAICEAVCLRGEAWPRYCGEALHL